MSASPVSTQPWSILIYRVSSRQSQQRILSAIKHSDHDGLIALGTDSRDGAHVVVESRTRFDESFFRHVVYSMDPDASCVHVTREHVSSARR